jgi:phage-related protein
MTMAPALATAFAALTGPIGIVAAAIAGCVAAIVLLWKHSETFRKSVKTAWAQIGAAVNDAVKAIKAAMKSAGVSGNDLKKAFSAIAKFITEIWGSKLGAIIQRVATTIAATIRALASTIRAISALMSGDWKKFGSNMASATKAMATGIVNAFVPVNRIKQLAQTAANGVRTVFSSMSSSIRSTITSAVNSAGSTWNGIKSKLTTPLNSAYSTVKSALTKIKHLFPMTIGKVFTGLKLPHFKVSGGKAPFGVGGKGSLPKWSVSWYKKGGIFDGPSVIGVGEAGPEAVIPIDRLQDMLNKMADSIVNGIAMNNMLQGAAAGGEVVIKNYLFESGPQLGETVVKTYDQYKKIIG